MSSIHRQLWCTQQLHSAVISSFVFGLRLSLMLTHSLSLSLLNEWVWCTHDASVNCLSLLHSSKHETHQSTVKALSPLSPTREFECVQRCVSRPRQKLKFPKILIRIATGSAAWIAYVLEKKNLLLLRITFLVHFQLVLLVLVCASTGYNNWPGCLTKDTIRITPGDNVSIPLSLLVLSLFCVRGQNV